MGKTVVEKIIKGFVWYLKNTFTFHPKSLKAFRILLGGIVAWNAVIRLSDLEVHYGPNGIAPIDFIQENLTNPGQWSLFFLHESLLFQGFLLVLTAIAGAMLATGYKTKYAKWACFLFIYSVNIRNTAIINTGDSLLQVLLFWSLFLPLSNPNQKQSTIVNFGFALQIAIQYWFTLLARRSSEVWFAEKSGVFYALNEEHYTTAFGEWLGNAPIEWLEILNQLVILAELLGPIVLFLPFRSIRMLGIASLAFMHLSFIASLSIGIFWLVSITALVPFIPFKSKYKEIKARTLWPKNILCTIAIALMIWMNLYSEELVPLGLPVEGAYVVEATGIAQRWAVYSPYPKMISGWFLITGITPSGEKKVLWPEDQAVYSEEKPARISQTFKNQRWRKLFYSWIAGNDIPSQTFFLEYLCKKNKPNIESIELVYFLEATQLPPLPQKETEKMPIRTVQCKN